MITMQVRLNALADVGRGIDGWYRDGCPEYDGHAVLRWTRRQLAATHQLPDVQLHIDEFFKDPPESAKPMVDWVRGRLQQAAAKAVGG